MMSIWNRKSRIVITCAKAITPFLGEELLTLGFPILSEGVSYVETEGTMEDAMSLNLFVRTGQRVLFLLKSFHAGNPDELYQRISRIEWEEYIPEDEYLCVTSSVDTPSIRDSRFANLKCKDAIVDRMKRASGRRPDSGPERSRVVVHLYWRDERCFLYFDTTGESLSKRGYRKIPLKAPMQETLASAVVLATGWNGDGNFVNPMCGSGSLGIEAALIGLNRAPGSLRNNFGFMHLRGFEETSWRALHKKAKAVAKQRLSGKIVVTDISQEAVLAAEKNAATAGVKHWMEFGKCDFSETSIPEGGGIVVLNPEYGQRLGEIEKLKETYKGIGDFFKNKCKGYTGYIFTGNLDLAKRVGLRAKRRIPFFNGDIECRLLEYELYEGSRKRPLQN
jgi:putative N6-adenine-specific DNA methylase